MALAQRKTPAKESWAAHGLSGRKSPGAVTGQGEARATRHRELPARLTRLMHSYRPTWRDIYAEIEAVKSGEQRAALKAPQDDEQALIMQRLEDSSLRRQAHLVARIKKGRERTKDVKNGGNSCQLVESTGGEKRHNVLLPRCTCRTGRQRPTRVANTSSSKAVPVSLPGNEKTRARGRRF